MRFEILWRAVFQWRRIQLYPSKCILDSLNYFYRFTEWEKCKREPLKHSSSLHTLRCIEWYENIGRDRIAQEMYFRRWWKIRKLWKAKLKFNSKTFLLMFALYTTHFTAAETEVGEGNARDERTYSLCVHCTLSESYYLFSLALVLSHLSVLVPLKAQFIFGPMSW